jgi:D-hydroxyproline dehydrogenase subunit gamma
VTLQRVLDQDRPELRFHLDGEALTAREGDTLLTAILAAGAGWLRESEFGDGRRAGFCLMGACQDCWVWLADGSRVRACTTVVADGIHVLTNAPRGFGA